MARGGKIGNKGGGRKPLAVEAKLARDAQAMFFDELDQDELEKKIQTGKFSIADRFKLTAMEGDTRILTSAHKKAVPDIIDVTSGGKPLQIAFDPSFDASSRKAKGDS